MEVTLKRDDLIVTETFLVWYLLPPSPHPPRQALQLYQSVVVVVAAVFQLQLLSTSMCIDKVLENL